MSEIAQGPGWWQASDGRWYPPQAVPDARPAAVAAPAPTGLSPRAKGAAALAVLSVLAGPVGPVVAVWSLVTAARAGRQIDASYGRYTGRGLVTAARALAVVELAVVAAVAGVLGARALTADRPTSVVHARRTQALVREALDSERAFHTARGRFTGDPGELGDGGPELAAGAVPAGTDVVTVTASPTEVWLAARSPNGTCYYLHQGPADTSYAVDPACGPSSAQTYRDFWP